MPGRSKLPGAGPVIKLSSNETPLGPARGPSRRFARPRASSTAIPTARRPRCARRSAGFTASIPSIWFAAPARTSCSTCWRKAYLGPGDEAIFTEHGFLVYKIVILAAGATPVVAPETDFRTDVDAILARVTPRTRAVFIANPNNPTGTYIAFDEVRRLRQRLPENVLLVLDGAYAEYVNRNDYEAGIELVATTPNTVMTRTFSKIYGLASARVGWAYCPAERRRACSTAYAGRSMSAGRAWPPPSPRWTTAPISSAPRRTISEWLDWLASEIRALGIPVTDSAANFLLLHFSAEQGRTAADAEEFLAGRRHHSAAAGRLRHPARLAADGGAGA